MALPMQMTIGKTKLCLVIGDIADQDTDAVVTAAHWRLNKGTGTDGTIHTKGGPKIYEECRRIGGCPIGDAIITTGGNLKARHVIHAVGPVWRGGNEGEQRLLSSAYRRSLEVAAQNGLHSISLPSISTGAFGYPMRLAAPVALQAIIDFLLQAQHELLEVRVVLYTREDDAAYSVYATALEELVNCPQTKGSHIVCDRPTVIKPDRVDSSRSSLGILYVENHAVFASNVIHQFLSSHTVTVVPSLCAARQALKTGNLDLLLVDYDLDDGKGDELVKELKATGAAVPIIGVSSHKDGNNALLRAGAAAICGKMQFDRIQAIIDTVTARARRSDANRDLLWWVIPGSLAGMPMPFIHPDRRMNLGGPLTAQEDELPALYASGIRAVVSLLNIPSDAAVYESSGFAFICLPVPDGGAPTAVQAREFIRFTDLNLAEHRPVAVHCEAGLGRTGTMLAAYLISLGDSAKQAIGRVRAAESSAIETTRQIQFLENFAAQR